MTQEQLQQHLKQTIFQTTNEFQRLFHGRGGFYEAYEYLTIDSIGNILLVCFYEKVEEERALIHMVQTLFTTSSHKILIVQRRYEKNAPCEILEGVLEEKNILYENKLKYGINFNNQNIGFFADMKIGHEYVQQYAKNKNVLNLFSYTCAFSVCAIEGGATQVVNVDMAKSALTQGRANHHLNNHDTKKVKFMPYNILKSWSRIKKEAPYDLIIIDPPSFQKGSFAATKDYEKIVKRLDELASSKCTVLCALNAPELDTNFMRNLFEKFAPTFIYEQRLNNLESFPAINDEKALKSLIFKKEAL